jgi:hypothetical protein
MIETTQDREGEDLATRTFCWCRSSFLLGNLLLDPLMRLGPVDGANINVEYPLEMLLMQDEQVIEALALDTSQKAVPRQRPTGCATSCSAALVQLGSILPGSDVLCYM